MPYCSMLQRNDDPRGIKKILGLRKIPATAGRNYFFGAEWPRHACVATNRRRKIYLLPGAGFNEGGTVPRSEPAHRIDEGPGRKSQAKKYSRTFNLFGNEFS